MNFTGGSAPKRKRKPSIKHTPKAKLSVEYKKKALRLAELTQIRNVSGLSQAGMRELADVEAYLEGVARVTNQPLPGKITPKPIKNPIKSFVDREIGSDDITRWSPSRVTDRFVVIDTEEPQPGVKLEGEEE